MQNPSATASPGEPLCVTLGMEEVYVLLRLLNGKAMPGLDLAPFELDAQGIPSESARRALAAATNSLIAHGIAEPVATSPIEMRSARVDADQPHVKLDLPADVVALLGTCAFGEYTLRLTLLTSAGAVDVYLHELRHVGVAHTSPLPGVHKFTGLHGREGVLDYVRALLGLEAQQTTNTTPFSIPAAILYPARDSAIAGNRMEATRLLRDAGVSAPTAETFANAMSYTNSLGSAAIALRTAGGTSQEQRFAFVVSKMACFILTPSNSTDTTYTVQEVSAQQMFHHFQTALPLE